MIRRDALRVVALVAGDSRYRDEVAERAGWWADQVVVAPLPESDSVLSYKQFWAEAWRLMEEQAAPSPGDFIAVLESDEVVIDHDVVRAVLQERIGWRVGVRLSYLWSPHFIRPDMTRQVWMFIPYMRYGTFGDAPSLGLRGPQYVVGLRYVEESMADVLSYRYMTDDDKLRWGDIMLRSPDRQLQSLASRLPTSPLLQEWDKGGLLNVDHLYAVEG